MGGLMKKHKICITGAGGRMGRMLIEAVTKADDCVLGGALDMPDSLGLGLDASGFLGTASGVTITSDVAHALKGCHALIDFTRPEGTMAHLAQCRAQGINMVIGTTGFSDAQKEALQEASQDIAIMLAPNMSVGVNVTLKLLEMAAKSLSAGYDIEIIETHHRHKIDAPSGTALKMGEVVAQALGRDLKGHAVFAREGITGARDPSAIGFSAIRGGDIVGDHTVLFAGIGERIEITHKASTREGYAQGALRAVRFLAGKKKGMYDMFDVLGLNG
jgi:4-hydroxy-tetrahydrodipicolinate reductase